MWGDDERGRFRQVDDAGVQRRRGPFVADLVRKIVLEAAGEGEHEGHDVRGDVVVEDAAEVGDRYRVGDELRRVIARWRGDGRPLQPLQLARHTHQLGRDRAKRGIGIGDLAPGIVQILGHHDAQFRHFRSHRRGPSASKVPLRRQKHQFRHTDQA